ncbi:MAG: hypothetical protein RLZZ344_336 [Pseudomonadota bacterium]
METPNDPFAFLKAAWPGFQSSASGGGFAASSLPTTDLEEIDRRIADLKTVEQWLSLNLNILKTTIQGLEIQRGTIAAVQSWQASMAEFGKSGREEAFEASRKSDSTQTTSAPPVDASTEPANGAADSPDSAPTAGTNPTAQWWWSSMQDQFNALVQTAQAMQSAEPATARKSTTRPGDRPAEKKPQAASATRRKAAAKKPSTR